MQKKFLGNIHGNMGKQKAIIIFCVALLSTMGRCWAMQEQAQDNDADCYKSYECEICARAGWTSGAALCVFAGVDEMNVRNDERIESAFGQHKRAATCCGVALCAMSLPYLAYASDPDHSCLYGYYRKIACVMAGRKNQAPAPVTMHGEKKD